MEIGAYAPFFMTFSNTVFSELSDYVFIRKGLMARKHSHLGQLPAGAYGDLWSQQPKVIACQRCVY